jgi:4-hydroxy-tetrahydrodipicolinate synthase
MPVPSNLSGVFAAAVTPMKSDLSPDLGGLMDLIQFLHNRGCHGVLLMGTTGEGPSFSLNERLAIYQTAASIRQIVPSMRFLAGTGTPSLEDTILLTRSAFDLGLDGVVVLPPYYYRKATDEGLFSWFSHLIKTAVPEGGAVLGYHIPAVSGVGLSIDLVSRLRVSFPDQFIGIKDSSGDPDWACTLGARFGNDLVVLNGNDRLFSHALNQQASGCITAMANVLSPLHREVWDGYQTGEGDPEVQGKLSRLREVLDRYPPMPPVLKMILSRLHGFPNWKVKPPLTDLSFDQEQSILVQYQTALE